MHASKVSKLGRVDAMLCCPEFDSPICHPKDSKIRGSTFYVEKITIRLKLS